MRSKTQSVDSIFVPSVALRLFVLVAALAVVGRAEAQWTWEPVVKVGGEKDDNATLSVRTDDVLDVTGFLYDVSARFNFDSATHDFFVTPQLISRNYDDAPEIDSDDVFVRSGYLYTGRTNEFSFRFNFDEQSARTAERSDANLDIDDPADIPDDETGLVRFQGDRTRMRFAPEFKHNFSAATSMTVGASYLTTTYDEVLSQFLNDFSDIRLNAGLERAFTDRTLGIFEVTARHYELDDGSSEADGVGFQAGFETQLTPTTTARVLLGLEDTDSSISETDPTPTADISLRRRLETINILAQYRRTVAASGVGRLSSRDTVSLNLSRLLSEKVTVGIGARVYQTNSLDDVVTIDERNYVQLRSQFIWNITSSFAAEVDYRFTFQKRSALPESANSNQINIWFSYQPNSVDRRFRPSRELTVPRN
jgi:hypothetical protein